MFSVFYLPVLLVLLLAALGVGIRLYYLLGKSRDEIQLLKSKLEFQKSEPPSLSYDHFKYKLDPHLLKNALNAIQSHAYQSYYALDKLSNILDYILYESDSRFLPLKDEIDFAQNLIEINRLKISPLFDLHVRKRISDECAELPIAPFVTINPIENAFKHADLQHENAFISVVFEAKDGIFLLSVSNSIQSGATASRDQKGGLGDKTFIDRLQRIYGQNYRLTTETDGEVYQVKLEIQLDAKSA